MKDNVVKELFKLGAHFSFARSRRHPSAEGFIFGYKNRHAVIDLEQTVAATDKAKDFIKSVAATGGTIMFVGSKHEARQLIASAAESIDMPYVNNRWIGGTLTNFKNIRRRIDRLAEIREAEETGELQKKYTKKERAVIDKEKNKLIRFFGSLSGLNKLPQALVVIDSGEEGIAVAEAISTKVPVVSFSGTDCNISKVKYPIVGNDTSAPTIKWFLNEIVLAYNEGKLKAKETPNDNNGTDKRVEG